MGYCEWNLFGNNFWDTFWGHFSGDTYERVCLVIHDNGNTILGLFFWDNFQETFTRACVYVYFIEGILN